MRSTAAMHIIPTACRALAAPIACPSPGPRHSAPKTRVNAL